MGGSIGSCPLLLGRALVPSCHAYYVVPCYGGQVHVLHWLCWWHSFGTLCGMLGLEEGRVGL